jgi:hypothetical protein
MDARQFRTVTSPDLRPSVNSQKVENIGWKREAPQVVTAPIEDARFSGYAAPMSDGRLVTDYRTHCAYNFSPSKYGESVRLWLQHNADAVIQVTRQRQAERNGALYVKAKTVPPAQQTTSCNEFECQHSYNWDRNAIGLVRHEGVPDLFGTFADATKPMPYPTGASLTTTFEGGRNTPRGRQFTPLAGRSIATEGVSG